MTIEKISSKIRTDIAKIKRERRAIKPSMLNENLRNYLTTRQHTLNEILSLFGKKNNPL